MVILLVYLIMIVVITTEVNFRPRFDRVNGKWGVWHTPCRNSRRQREFTFLNEIFK